jgi:hypothetical protein
VKIASAGFGVLLAGASAAAVVPPSSDPEQATAAATGFYSAYATFRPSDGIPAAGERARLEPFISPALDRLLRDGEAAEQHFAAVTKHMSPPLIEGDLFTSNFEGSTAWHVGQCEVAADSAHCPVAFGYRSHAREDARPVNWTDTVYLVHTPAGWRVDDIAYGANAAFGNKGRLTETLRDAIRDGNDATQ